MSTPADALVDAPSRIDDEEARYREAQRRERAAPAPDAGARHRRARCCFGGRWS